MCIDMYIYIYTQIYVDVDVDVDVEVDVDMDVDGIPYSIYYNHMISNMRDVINMGSANLMQYNSISIYIYNYSNLAPLYLQ